MELIRKEHLNLTINLSILTHFMALEVYAVKKEMFPLCSKLVSNIFVKVVLRRFRVIDAFLSVQPCAKENK